MGFVDPGLPGDFRGCWAAREPYGVRGVGGVEGRLAGVVDRVAGPEVDRRGRVPADARVAVDVVVLGEESLTQVFEATVDKFGKPLVTDEPELAA